MDINKQNRYTEAAAELREEGILQTQIPIVITYDFHNTEKRTK